MAVRVLALRLKGLQDRLSAEPGRHQRSKVPSSLFTTAELPQELRAAAWQESIGVIFDVQPLNPAGFDARVEAYLLDDIMLSRCTASEQKFDRDTLRIAHDSLDHYMVQLFMEGSVDMAVGSRRRIHGKPGTLIGFDFGEVLDSFNTDFDLLTLVIPRRRLAPLLARPDSLHGVMVDPTSGTGSLLANYFANLFAVAPALGAEDAGAAARTLLDLVALAFNGTHVAIGDVPESFQQAELLRVQCFIKDNLARRDLGPDVVAAALGHSRARLYRLFAPVGGVFEYIKEQRLRRSLGDLLSAEHAHLQISEIAYTWGFRDPAHFTKAFRQRFGRTPSDARQAAKLRSRGRRDLNPRVGDRIYEEWISGIA